MMGRKIGKGAGGFSIYSIRPLSQRLDFCNPGVGAQLRMRRSVRDLASGSVVGTAAVGDLEAVKIVAVGGGVEVAREGGGAGAVIGLFFFFKFLGFLWNSCLEGFHRVYR